MKPLKISINISQKFNNKTNGVTHRRWLMYSNPELSKLITSKIGDSWIKNPDDLEKLLKYQDDRDTLESLRKVKHLNKIKLANYIEKNYGIKIDTKLRDYMPIRDNF